jgi:hypothetical protein
MADRRRIGIDLDNTLIDYDGVFRALAAEAGLIEGTAAGGKAAVRAALRALPDGELAWQRLQGQVYGKGIAQAVLFDGVDDFLRQARGQGCEIFIVSHKTEFGHYDPDRVNLREAALGWMERRGFFHEDGFAVPQANVLFFSTRAEKIAAIAGLGLSLFVDDLPEVLEDEAFPRAVMGILFTGGVPTGGGYPRSAAHWHDIAAMVFG